QVDDFVEMVLHDGYSFGKHSFQGLFQVRRNILRILRILDADGQAEQSFIDAVFLAFFLRYFDMILFSPPASIRNPAIPL
ncbi:MAG: hypothetical protein FWD31_10460, partial [Planctomycetaceae bacterium]|nr:hypothetical protein [Planctomycetaceae bacterium]